MLTLSGNSTQLSFKAVTWLVLIILTCHFKRAVNLHHHFVKPKFPTLKMSDLDIGMSSKPIGEKKLVNSQTQHGCEATADEENIVVLTTSFSPVREASNEVVWHEDYDEVSCFLIFLKISNNQLFSMRKECNKNLSQNSSL